MTHRHLARPAIERLMARVVETTGSCWVWTGAANNGYGRIGEGRKGGRLLETHRLAYETFVGPIPAGLQLDHLCRNPPCCNPAHLEPVTPKENTLRGYTLAARNAAKTHCPRGHPYDFISAGRRGCRICHNAQAARSRRRAVTPSAPVAD